MGLDLHLLPFDCDMDDFAFSHTLLSLERNRVLFDLLMNLENQKGLPVPKNFMTYCSRSDEGENCYGATPTTPYGERMMFVEVGVLMSLKDHNLVERDYKNKAVWAYLSCLPKSRKVALYWH